jgi:hypothetical protein
MGKGSIETWYKGYRIEYSRMKFDSSQEEIDTYHVVGMAGFNSIELAMQCIDQLTDREHPWRNGDLKELARLIRGERLLPHEAGQCNVCFEAFDLTLAARE